jgi:hypothetical protein
VRKLNRWLFSGMLLFAFLFESCAFRSSSSLSSSVPASTSSLSSSRSSESSSSELSSSSAQLLTVRFFNGTVLLRSYLAEKGETAHYDGETPTREKDDQYVYVFDGWTTYGQETTVDLSTVRIMGNLSFYAHYSTSLCLHTATFYAYSEEGALPVTEKVTAFYGTEIQLPVSCQLTKEKTATETFALEWKEKETGNIVSFPYPLIKDVTLIGSFVSSPREYAVVFRDENNSFLSMVTVPYGGYAAYPLTPPKKRESPKEYQYAFIGWQREGSSGIVDLSGYPITEDGVVFLAVYDVSACYVIWHSYPGSPSYWEGFVAYGSHPSAPSLEADFYLQHPKPADDQVDVFSGWSLDGGKTLSDLSQVKVINTMNITACFTSEELAVYSYDAESSSYIVTGHHGSEKEVQYVMIRDTYDDGVNGSHPVTKIGSGAFASCPYLLSIAFGANVREIASDAFRSVCYTLKSVSIPSSVRVIGDRAFSDQKSLTSLTLTEGLETIGEEAFAGTQIASVFLGSSVLSVGRKAFSGIGLKDLSFGTDFRGTFGAEAFSENHLSSLLLPLSLRSFPDNLFRLSDLDSLYFYGQSYRLSLFGFGTGNEGIRDAAHRYYYSPSAPDNSVLTYWHFVDGVKTLWTEKATLWSGFTYLYAEEAYSIRASLPVTDTSIHELVMPSYWDDGINGVHPVTSLAPSLFASPGWFSTVTSFRLSENLTAIPASCFASCTALSSVTLPDSCLSLGTEAFSYCLSLSKIRIPDSVTSIGDRCFQSTRLISVYLPLSVTSIGDSVFSSLQSGGMLSIQCEASSLPAGWSTSWLSGAPASTTVTWGVKPDYSLS